MVRQQKADHPICLSVTSSPNTPIALAKLLRVEIEARLVKDLVIPPADIERMREKFGDQVLKMGHLQEDGSVLVPVDCVLEAAQSLGTQTLTEAAETLKSDEMVNLLQSGEVLVERVGKARERKLRELIRKFQSELSENAADRQWKQIEKMVFGVDYPD